MGSTADNGVYGSTLFLDSVLYQKGETTICACSAIWYYGAWNFSFSRLDGIYSLVFLVSSSTYFDPIPLKESLNHP